MGKIRIDTGAVRVATARVSAQNMVGPLSSALSAARVVANPIFSISHGLSGCFSASERLIREIEGDVNNLTRTVTNIASSYESTEAALTSKIRKCGVGAALIQMLRGTPLSAGGSIFGGSAVIGGVALSGSVVGWKASLSKEGKWDLTKGQAYTGIKGKAEGWLAEGSVSGDYGLAHGKLEGKFGDVSAEGEVRASLLKDGKLDPGLELKGKVGASVLSGSAEGRLGTDYFDAHAKAKGEVLTASAEGTVRLDKDGVSVGAKAEAYAAKGEISGGLNLGLFKIDVGLEGKAGGAGVEFGAEADKNSVSGTIGAGLGLGAGLKVKLDWSGAGDFIDNAGTAISEAGAAIGEAAKGFTSFLGNVGSGVSSLWNWR